MILIRKQFHLLRVWGDVEPEIVDSFHTRDEMDTAALEARREDEEGKHGLFKLIVNPETNQIEAEAYSGAFFE